MLILLCITCFFAVCYSALMLTYARGWRLQSDFELQETFIPATKITVVIPARNEAKNIAACIHSVLQNHYPQHLLEVIVTDDHSTDNTYEIVTGLLKNNVRCFRLADFIKPDEHVNAYKKKALETAIAHASGELIVTTDADCIAPENWLKNIAAVYEAQKPAMIVAPVAFSNNGSLIQNFQSLDFMTMQGITVAAHRLQLGNMSNGANLAFSKNAFYGVKGYEGISHLASGDDYLLMMKMQKKFPGKMACLKTQKAIVETAPQPDWKSFFNQRIRWASKSGKYDDKKLTAVLILVYAFNVSLGCLFLGGFSNALFWVWGAVILLLKIVSELHFLWPVARFFNKKKELWWFPFLQPLHILYIISAGFIGLTGKYKWKGRKVR